VELARQAARLTPEDEHDVARRAEWCVPEQSGRLRGEEVRVTQRRQLALERLPALPRPQLDVLPVVQPGALHLPLAEREPERLDEMERGAGREARASRVSGVPVDLGMYEDDVGRQRSVASDAVPHP
jgi:hypothetical protein